MLNRFFKIIRRNNGTSFLEVMIALVIMSVVTTAIFKLYITQHKNYIKQDDLTIVQQNARSSIDELCRQIRMAGYGTPLGVPAIVASNTDPDTITLTYTSDTCETYLSSAMPQPSAELKCATDVSCFWDGQWVYIFEPDSGGGEWFEITHVQTGSNHLQHNTMPLSKAYSQDAIIMAMTQAKFYVDTTTNPNNPTLMVQLVGRQPQIYADNITDLQFRYRMKNGMVLDAPPVADDIREVLISITGRTENPDYDEEAQGVNDPYRYRTFSTSVFLRNVGL